jgi:hypothetical protein
MEVLVYVKLIGEIGYDQAVFGDGLSFGKTSSIEFEDFLKGEFEELVVSCGNRTSKLSKMERGHDGALKMIQTWWDIRAPLVGRDGYVWCREGTAFREHDAYAKKAKINSC